jgi:hypothetical protein
MINIIFSLKSRQMKIEKREEKNEISYKIIITKNKKI